VSVFETILYYVVPTAVLYGGIWAFAVLRNRKKRPQRYRLGQPWNFDPLWWTANPEGAHLPAAQPQAASGQRGGARGNW
jgi:hypothetical protein